MRLALQVVKNLPVQGIDAGVYRKNTLLVVTAKTLLRKLRLNNPALIHGNDIVTARVSHGLDQHGRRRLPGEAGNGFGANELVSGQYQELAFSQLLGLGQGVRRAKLAGLGDVADAGAQPLAAAQSVKELLLVIADHQHHITDARGNQGLQDILNQGTPGHRKHGLGPVQGKRPQPVALATGQNNRLL